MESIYLFIAEVFGHSLFLTTSVHLLTCHHFSSVVSHNASTTVIRFFSTLVIYLELSIEKLFWSFFGDLRKRFCRLKASQTPHPFDFEKYGSPYMTKGETLQDMLDQSSGSGSGLPLLVS